MAVNLSISSAHLERVDRLTRPEFERRYLASPHIRNLVFQPNLSWL
jgi:hypothetical protein